MKIKLKNFWYENKFDIYWLILWIIFWIISFGRYNMKMWHWQYWAILTVGILFRVIGYREGKRKTVKDIIERKDDIILDIRNNEFKLVTCKLKDIPNGISFSLLNDKLQTKYFKSDNVNQDSCECWNITDNKMALINNDSLCNVYDTRIIYMPIVKMKEK